MKFMDRATILMRGQDCIPYEEFEEICDLITNYYHYTSVKFWMWKMFQFGFVYGKRAERTKKRNK